MKHIKLYNESLAGQYYDTENGMGLNSRKAKKSMKKLAKQMRKAKLSAPKMGKMKRFDEFSEQKDKIEN